MKALRAASNTSTWISATLESPFALPTPPERPAQHPPAMPAELFQHADSNGMPYTPCGQAKFPRKNGVQSTQTRQRKRCAAAPHGRRGQGASRPARPGAAARAPAAQPRLNCTPRSASLHRIWLHPPHICDKLTGAPVRARAPVALWHRLVRLPACGSEAEAFEAEAGAAGDERHHLQAIRRRFLYEVRGSTGANRAHERQRGSSNAAAATVREGTRRRRRRSILLHAAASGANSDDSAWRPARCHARRRHLFDGV